MEASGLTVFILVPTVGGIEGGFEAATLKGLIKHQLLVALDIAPVFLLDLHLLAKHGFSRGSQPVSLVALAGDHGLLH